ncbi:MAG: glycosyltransferase family 39 protein [Candidatus Micrarchaeota archaeon]|nr:glycosyltransferase family 39 protein [Candidatus Micrarchaeota archaeon]
MAKSDVTPAGNAMRERIGKGIWTRAVRYLSEREAQYLIAILAFGLVLSLLLIKGPSFYGDDAAYLQYVPSILGGTFGESINIFSIRLMADFPLAIFIGIFGYTNLGAGAWSLVSYLVTMVAVYLMGRELYNGRAGLFSALLFAFYPLVLKYNTTPEPMLPMAMFVSLSALFFVYGRKRGSLYSYILSGALAFLGTLANPLAYLYVLFYAVYIVLDAVYGSLKRHRLEFDFRALGVFLGLLTAIALMGYVNLLIAPSGNPFYEIGLTNNYYSAAGGPDEIFYTNPSLTFYLSGYFPYDFSDNVISPLQHFNLPGVANGIGSISNAMFSMTDVNLNEVGMFGYATVLAGLYLLLKRDRRSYFALSIAAFVVAYMEFGSMSLTHYFPIYKLMRFTMLAAPMLMLVIGIACESFLSGGRAASRGRLPEGRIIRALVIIAAFAALLATSSVLDWFNYAYNNNSMIFVAAMANSVRQANLQGANFYAPGEISYYLPFYLGYPGGLNVGQYDNGAYGGRFMPTCASIPNDTYLVIPSTAVLQYINGYNLWNVNETWAYTPSECGSLSLYANLYANATLASLNPISPDFTGNIYYKQ